jgi:hypothetical protein
VDTGVVRHDQHSDGSNNLLNESRQFATDTLIAAVAAGHLHMCKHLQQLQEDISLVAAARVAYVAARTRNKQLLQWLLTDSGRTVSEAALFEHASAVLQFKDLETVLWLLEQGFKLPEDRYTGAYFESNRVWLHTANSLSDCAVCTQRFDRLVSALTPQTAARLTNR